MKNLMFIVFSILCVFSSYAGSVTVKKPCADKVYISKDIIFDKSLSLGEITINLLKDHGFDFVGETYGINQIDGTPIKGSDLEVISNSEMKAYGWCFSINGIIPESYPNMIYPDTNDNVIWFYAFAHYLDGEWVAQCKLASRENGCFGVSKF